MCLSTAVRLVELVEKQPVFAKKKKKNKTNKKQLLWVSERKPAATRMYALCAADSEINLTSITLPPLILNDPKTRENNCNPMGYWTAANICKCSLSWLNLLWIRTATCWFELLRAAYLMRYLRTAQRGSELFTARFYFLKFKHVFCKRFTPFYLHQMNSLL